MDKKKLMAKKAMLEQMSKSMRDDSYKGIGEGLKDKKMKKVTVMAPDEESLDQGLSKAQQLIKAKFGEAGLTEDEMSEELDEEIEDCPVCENLGCEHCAEMEEAIEE